MNIIHYIANLFKRKPVEQYPGFPIRVRLKSGGGFGFTKYVPSGTVLHARTARGDSLYIISSESIADNIVDAPVNTDPEYLDMVRSGGPIHEKGWTFHPHEVEVLP